MKSIPCWTDKLDDVKINAICINPEGNQLLVAADNKILVYNANEGTAEQPLKGHKDTVLCLCYSRDGKRFASGGADKVVIIWTSNLDGILKYSHNDAVQCLSYNPLTHQLASCSSGDFGLWSAEQKSVSKHKVPSRICACSWTNDGQYIALGMFNGIISIRNKSGEEKIKIERPNGCPVWCLSWNPSKDEALDILAVGDWSRKISFYHLNGKPITKDKPTTFDPTCMTWFPAGEFILIGGSDKKLYLYSKDGIQLQEISTFQGWVWSAAVKYKSQIFVYSCTAEGELSCHQVTFSLTHGLYKDRYAYRDGMTDVVVQHLITDQKVRIKCKDMVLKVAIYRSRLAVQMPDRVNIFELYSDDAHDMQYRVKDRIQRKISCNLLVICSQHLVMCQEKRLQAFSFQGLKEREWIMESTIRYVKVVGGPVSREAILVGLKNGSIMKIFIDNHFPVNLLKHNSAIRCLDISATQKRVAVVDEHNSLFVYDTKTKELLFEEPNATSVSFNTSCEDMLCFSGGGMLNIKAGTYPVHQQKMQGFVVGFTGSKIFCLQTFNMTTIDVPQSEAMYHYLDKKDFQKAYQVACLGVTDSDWKSLATHAIEGLAFEVAKKSFIRIRDLRYLELISSIEDRKRRGENNEVLFHADIFAHQGRFADAAKLYRKGGKENNAMTMYTDLKMFDKAKEFMGRGDNVDKKQFLTKQAEWAKSTQAHQQAAEMFLNAGETLKAVQIIGDNKWVDLMIDVSRRLDKAEREPLLLSSKYLKEFGEFGLAAEVLEKLGDVSELIDLHIVAQNWEDAFNMATKYPEFKDKVYLPYAQWLAESDKFEDAQAAFHKAGRMEDAVAYLEILTLNAVNENRFNDAGYYYWKLSIQCLEIAAKSLDLRTEMLNKFSDYQRLAAVYYAFHTIHRSIEEPFTSQPPDTLFNLTRFLLQEFAVDIPRGISRLSTLYAIAKHAKSLGAYKLARFSYEKLQNIQIPEKYQDIVDIGSIVIRSKEFSDNEELLPMCYRCSTTNPLLNQQGNMCINCRQPFVYSYSSFDILPLVEFKLAPGISDEEAVNLLEVEAGNPAPSDKWKESQNKGFESLQLENAPPTVQSTFVDPFTTPLSNFDESELSSEVVTVDKPMLQRLKRSEVLIRKWPFPLSYQYYRSMIPGIDISLCQVCNMLFISEDYELLVMQKGCCPFCRAEIDT